MSTHVVLPDPTSQPTLDVCEAAALLGIGKSAAYMAAHSGDLPVIRIGRRLRVPTAAILRMLQVEGGADAA
jgi:excisionase family DNA binding protein